MKEGNFDISRHYISTAIFFPGTSSEEGVGICFSIAETLLKRKVTINLKVNMKKYNQHLLAFKYSNCFPKARIYLTRQKIKKRIGECKCKMFVDFGRGI